MGDKGKKDKDKARKQKIKKQQTTAKKQSGEATVKNRVTEIRPRYQTTE